MKAKSSFKLTEFQAEAIVEAWRANGLFGAVVDCLPRDGFYPYGIHIRAYIGEYHKQISDALWDGLYNKAKKMLMHYGIPKKRVRGMYIAARTEVERYDKRKVMEFRSKST